MTKLDNIALAIDKLTCDAWGMPLGDCEDCAFYTARCECALLNPDADARREGIKSYLIKAVYEEPSS